MPRWFSAVVLVFIKVENIYFSIPVLINIFVLLKIQIAFKRNKITFTSSIVSDYQPIFFPEYEDVMIALQRVQKALGASGETALAARVAGAAGTLLCPDLVMALATRTTVLTATRHKRLGLNPPYTHRATDRLKDVSNIF